MVALAARGFKNFTKALPFLYRRFNFDFFTMPETSPGW